MKFSSENVVLNMYPALGVIHVAGTLCKLSLVRLPRWSGGGSCYSLFPKLLATLRVFRPSRGVLSKPGESQQASSITCGFRDSFGPPVVPLYCVSPAWVQSFAYHGTSIQPSPRWAVGIREWRSPSSVCFMAVWRPVCACSGASSSLCLYASGLFGWAELSLAEIISGAN